jgi:hypothetical protein
MNIPVRQRDVAGWIRLRLDAFISSRRRLLILGLSSTLVGILLAASFQFISDHRWYWSVAPFMCVVVMLAAAFGGLLVGRTFARTHNTQLWMVIVGTILCLVWIATGILAASLGALGMYQLPLVAGHVGWDNYADSVLFSGSQVRFLQITAGTGFIGGVALGLGLARRRVSAMLSLSK